MHQVYSPKKDKSYQYDNAEIAEQRANQVMSEQKCKLILDAHGDWVAKSKKSDG